MRAITVTDRDAGVRGMRLADRPDPLPAVNDVLVRVETSGFTRGELDWPGTWVDRAGRDRTPSIPGHELVGTVAALGYGTTGLTVGQRVVGMTDPTRDGTLAELVAVEARNLAPLRSDLDASDAAALPISGLTAWQAVIEHGRAAAGQSVLVLGAGGGVGSIAVQLAADAGLHVIGAGRARDRGTVLESGASGFVDLGDPDALEAVGEVDLVIDVIGGGTAAAATRRVRAGGRLVTIAEPPTDRPEDGSAVFFIVEPDRKVLGELAERLRDGRLRTRVARTVSLEDAPATLAESGGKTIIRVAE